MLIDYSNCSSLTYMYNNTVFIQSGDKGCTNELIELYLHGKEAPPPLFWQNTTDCRFIKALFFLSQFHQF